MQEKKEKLQELENETQNVNFWENQNKAKEVSQEISDIKEELEKFYFLEKEIKELNDLHKLAGENLIEEIDKKLKELEKEIKKQEFKVFLSKKYDKNNAILEIFSGAGGQDHQDP